MKYKIELTCWDYGEPKPYKDEVDQLFDNEKDAMIVLLQCVIDEADSLNEPDAYGNRGRYFSIDLEGGDGFDAVIRCWDGPEDYMNVTGYKIIKANNEYYNQKLRDRHGDNITVKIIDCHDDDGSRYYTYTTKNGASDTYETVEQAYEAANDYLNNIELYI